jgi:hypothetical protein
MMATRDDVTVRIDTELRDKARGLEINMSRLLEGALRDEIVRRETMAATLEDAQVYKLDLGEDGIGRLTGVLLGEARGIEVYLTDDERVIVYESEAQRYSEVDDYSDFEDWFSHDRDVYVQVMDALGETPEFDI